MPYIKQSDRQTLSEVILALQTFNERRSLTAGELNYLLTRCVQTYLAGRSQSYEAYNSAIGALESAKLELYRRQIAAYEMDKIALNGDVY